MNPLDLAETLGHEAALVFFYTAILADLPFKNGLGAEYGFSFGSIDDLPHTTRNLAVHLALERAAPLRPLGGHLRFVQGGGLVR
jgi:hypothetical protein